MGNGNIIAEAGRGIKKKDILKLQENEWARKQGGICNILEYTEEHAVFFALRDGVENRDA